MDHPGLTQLASHYSFAETVQRLLFAFTEHGMTIFVSIDQQAAAHAAGLTMPPTHLILFGNPSAGTLLMLAQPSVGIDLPLKVLVTEDAGAQVIVRFNTTHYIVERHGVAAELSAKLAPAEILITHTVTL